MNNIWLSDFFGQMHDEEMIDLKTKEKFGWSPEDILPVLKNCDTRSESVDESKRKLYNVLDSAMRWVFPPYYLENIVSWYFPEFKKSMEPKEFELMCHIASFRALLYCMYNINDFYPDFWEGKFDESVMMSAPMFPAMKYYYEKYWSADEVWFTQEIYNQVKDLVNEK
jgi:hypothetical protein